MQPVPLTGLNRALFPVLDVEPRTPQNLRVLGIDAAAIPTFKAAMDAASASGQLFATDPIPLVQSPGQLGIVLYTPVYRNGGPEPVGFITFAYRLDHTVVQPGETLPFSIALADQRAGSAGPLLRLDSQGSPAMATAGAAEPYTRDLQFGTRNWVLQYQPVSEPGRRARAMAINAAAIGLALTCILVGLFGYVVHNNIRLNREVELRAGVEQRLSAVIRELNHRVMNMLAVIQSIVMRSLQPGVVVEEARDSVIGRLHAMSHAVALLTETEWRGINLRDLFSSQVMPVTASMSCDGPDIVIGARAAQAMSLLFFELASNARKFGALAVPGGSVNVRWSVSDEPKPTFRLRWEETGGAPRKEPERSGFGMIVLDRVAPEAIRGTSRRVFTPTGFVYELEAPLWGLGDKGREE
jgi:two-component sensor histidine kinase